ncbi:MAG: hypothetical protein AB7P69_08345, partial [Candidatus Binatia bacterium]
VKAKSMRLWRHILQDFQQPIVELVLTSSPPLTTLKSTACGRVVNLGKAPQPTAPSLGVAIKVAIGQVNQPFLPEFHFYSSPDFLSGLPCLFDQRPFTISELRHKVTEETAIGYCEGQ